jgi:hypothetical protein
MAIAIRVYLHTRIYHDLAWMERHYRKKKYAEYFYPDAPEKAQVITSIC